MKHSSECRLSSIGQSLANNHWLAACVNMWHVAHVSACGTCAKTSPSLCSTISQSKPVNFCKSERGSELYMSHYRIVYTTLPGNGINNLLSLRRSSFKNIGVSDEYGALLDLTTAAPSRTTQTVTKRETRCRHALTSRVFLWGPGRG